MIEVGVGGHGDQHKPERIQDSLHLVRHIIAMLKAAVTISVDSKIPVFGPYDDGLFGEAQAIK
jgi:hypothetical protein